MIRPIKEWWRPVSYRIAYCKELGSEDKYDSKVFESKKEADDRFAFLCSCDLGNLRLEGLDFTPGYIRMEESAGPNPIGRLFNRPSSKRFIRSFGFKK